MNVHGVALAAALTMSVGSSAWQVQEKAPALAAGNLYAVSVENLAKWATADLSGTPPIIEIDPRVLGPGGRGMPLMSDALHPPAAFAGVARDKAVGVMTLERALRCTGAGARECRTDGRFVAIAFDAATVAGDSATVIAFVRVSRVPTAAELARMQQSSNASAALARFGNEAGSATLFRLSLARQAGVWAVVRREIIGQT